jgi:DNA-binding transcriptional LysR family regulator
LNVTILENEIMDRFDSMRIFVTVAEQGGFAAAARTLGLSPPAVTRGVAELEQRLGVTLFHRSTRAVALSDEGARFLSRARQILSDVEDAERQMQGAGADPSGQLYVTAPVQFGRLHVLPVVADMLNRYPALDIRMMLFDRNVRIVEEGIDIAVRIGALPDSSLKALQIGSVRQAIVGSPGYFARNGVPSQPSDLARHAIIASTGPRAINEWRIAKRLVKMPRRPRLMLNTVDSIVTAAEAGLGIANLLSYQVEDRLGDGRLVEVFGGEDPDSLPIHLLFDAARARIPGVRAFIDAMRARGEAMGWRR